jgi:hypothetical protein
MGKYKHQIVLCELYLSFFASYAHASSGVSLASATRWRVRVFIMIICDDWKVLEIYYTILKLGMLTRMEFSSYEIHEVHGNITDEFQTHIYYLLLMKEHKIWIGPDELVKKFWRILTAPTDYLHPIICDTPVLLAVALAGTQYRRLEINSCTEWRRQARNFARNLRCWEAKIAIFKWC